MERAPSLKVKFAKPVQKKSAAARPAAGEVTEPEFGATAQRRIGGPEDAGARGSQGGRRHPGSPSASVQGNLVESTPRDPEDRSQPQCEPETVDSSTSTEDVRGRPPGAGNAMGRVMIARLRAEVQTLQRREGLPTGWSAVQSWMEMMEGGQCRCGLKERVHCCPYSVELGEADNGVHVAAQNLAFQQMARLSSASRPSVGTQASHWSRKSVLVQTEHWCRKSVLVQTEPTEGLEGQVSEEGPEDVGVNELLGGRPAMAMSTEQERAKEEMEAARAKERELLFLVEVALQQVGEMRERCTTPEWRRNHKVLTGLARQLQGLRPDQQSDVVDLTKSPERGENVDTQQETRAGRAVPESYQLGRPRSNPGESQGHQVRPAGSPARTAQTTSPHQAPRSEVMAKAMRGMEGVLRGATQDEPDRPVAPQRPDSPVHRVTHARPLETQAQPDDSTAKPSSSQPGRSEPTSSTPVPQESIIAQVEPRLGMGAGEEERPKRKRKKESTAKRRERRVRQVERWKAGKKPENSSGSSEEDPPPPYQDVELKPFKPTQPFSYFSR